MTRHILTGSCNLPAGKILIVIADVPVTESIIKDRNGDILRKFWTSKRIFKRKGNADRYKQSIRDQHRNQELNRILVEKNLFNFN